MNKKITLIYHSTPLQSDANICFDLMQFLEDERAFREALKPIKSLSVKAPAIQVLKDKSKFSSVEC